MQGFHPAAVERRFANGGVVGFLKRAAGLSPKRPQQVGAVQQDGAALPEPPPQAAAHEGAGSC